jgi:hypothetical protein
MNRAEFLRLLCGGLAASALAQALPRGALAAAAEPDYDFWFTRLMYDSGNWDVDQRMPANLIMALIEYTNLRVDPKEHVLALADPRMLTAPFCYLAGHKLVEFNADERRNFEQYVRRGGFVFVDDCNHDIDGLFARSFEAEMASIFGARPCAGYRATTRCTRASSPSTVRRPPGSSSTAGATTWCTSTSEASRSTAASASSTATRTTVASGTTTGATSAGWPRTTRSSR